MRSYQVLALVISSVIGLFAQSGMPPAHDSNLEQFLRGYFDNPNEKSYTSASVSLSGQASKEVIVYLYGPEWCGSGGCTALVLAPEGSSFRVVSKLTVTNLPIRVLQTESNGWHDISVRVRGGGVSACEARLRFDGKGYPTNPTVPPAECLKGKVPGQTVISDKSLVAK